MDLFIDKIYLNSPIPTTLSIPFDSYNSTTVLLYVVDKSAQVEVKSDIAKNLILDFIFENFQNTLYHITLKERKSAVVAGGFPIPYADAAYITFIEDEYSSSVEKTLCKMKLSQ